VGAREGRVVAVDSFGVPKGGLELEMTFGIGEMSVAIVKMSVG
jgi:hypothetical protein